MATILEVSVLLRFLRLTRFHEDLIFCGQPGFATSESRCAKDGGRWLRRQSPRQCLDGCVKGTYMPTYVPTASTMITCSQSFKVLSCAMAGHFSIQAKGIAALYSVVAILKASLTGKYCFSLASSLPDTSADIVSSGVWSAGSSSPINGRCKLQVNSADAGTCSSTIL
jgi:hypothetical protein